MRGLTLLGSASVAAALPQWGSWQPSGSSSSHAVYVATNEASGNSVVAMSVGSDGSLSGGSSYSTGGNGGNYVNGTTQEPIHLDGLSSQDSLIQVGGYLFVVNAGSDTVSMFSISASSPTDLTLVGNPASTNGDFPSTIAASSALNLVCVGNTGANSGVSCSSYSASGIAGFDALRPVNVGQTQTPPTGPIPGFGDIIFSEDNTKLLAAIKGNGKDFKGGAVTYDVTNGQVGTTPTLGVIPGSAVPFATALIPGSNNDIFMSDAGFGGYIINDQQLSAQPIEYYNVSSKLVACWAQTTSDGRGFFTGPGLNELYEVSLTEDSTFNSYAPGTVFNGMTDFRIMGNYLWALSTSNGSYATSIQTFDISSPGAASWSSVYAVPGAGINTDGMAIY